MSPMTDECVSKERKAALRGLMDDPAPVVQTALKAEFQRLGQTGRRILEEIVLEAEGAEKRRAIACLEEVFGPDPSQVVMDLILNLNYELETGLIMLNRVIDPEIEPASIHFVLDTLAKRCRQIMVESADPMDVCRVINRVLFHEEGYRGYRAGSDDPAACCIGSVLKEKRGLSIILTCIYILVAQRLQLDLEAIALPGRFVVGCFKGDWPVYIDPLRGGATYSLEEMHGLLDGMDKDPEVHYLAPAPVGEVLFRICLELAGKLREQGQSVEAGIFAEFIRAFKQSHAF